MENAKKGDRVDGTRRIADLEAKLKTQRVELKALIEGVSKIVKAEGDEPVPAELADDVTAEAVADIFSFSITTGVVASLAAIVEEKILAAYPAAFGRARPIAFVHSPPSSDHIRPLDGSSNHIRSCAARLKTRGA